MKSLFSNYLTPFKLKRILAFIIDIIIIMLIVRLSKMILGYPDFSKYKELIAESNNIVDQVKQREMQTLALSAYIKAWNLSLIYFFTYEVICQFIFKGATIGKKIMKIRLYSTKDRNLFSYYLALTLRSLVKFLSIFLFRAYPFLISTLFFIADDNGQASHDRIFKLQVKKTK